MTEVLIGKRVILQSLLRQGHFPGTIITTSALNYSCTVKLECQDEPVDNVLYYPEEPKMINSSYLQVCWPVPAEGGK